MTFRKMLGVAFVVVCSGLQGCASIVGDSRYPVAVSSAPAGASFEITNKEGAVVHSGTTPATVTLKSGAGYFARGSYTLRFSKDGYPDKSIELKARMSGWYWGNFVFGGLIGLLIVDPLTGAMYKLPEDASADLGQPLAQAGMPALTIAAIDTLTPAQRERLILLD